MEHAPKEKQIDISYDQYNQWGEKYVKNERDFYIEKSDPTRDFFRSVLEKNLQGKVLVDVGCGAGDELLEYARMGASKVIGIEPSSTMREIAKTTVTDEPTIELMDGSFTALPFESESTDIVTARYSLHIISELEKAFEEVARILKPNGLFLVSVSHPKYDARVAEKQGKNIGDRVQIKLFKGAVIVDNATHTMDEYLGETSERYFICEDSLEYAMGSQSEEYTDLVLQYRKR